MTYTGSLGNSVGLERSAGGKRGPFVNREDQPWVLDHIRSPEEIYASYPTVYRNGQRHDWQADHSAQYQAPEGESPVSLGFREGVLRVQSNDYLFEGTMQEDGTYQFTNSER